MIQAAGIQQAEAQPVTLQEAKTRTGPTVLNIVEPLTQELLHHSIAEDFQDLTKDLINSKPSTGDLRIPLFFRKLKYFKRKIVIFCNILDVSQESLVYQYEKNNNLIMSYFYCVFM